MTSRSFDRVAAAYDATRQLPAEAEAAIAAGIVRHTGATPTTRLLEVGVGTGRIALPIARRGHRCCGVDISLAMLRAAQIKAQGQPGLLALAQADAAILPFAEATFDVGFVVHLFHLLPDWRAALAEILRVIRPGGFFLYGAEQADETAGSDEFSAHWRTVLARHGHTLRTHRSTDDEIVPALRSRGMTTTTETIATWTRAATVQQHLDRHASRDYSSSWSIPEPTFRAANAALASWADERYPDRGAIVRHGARFTIVIARRD